MTLALRVLIGLVAGFLLGLALAGSSSSAAGMAIAVLTQVGTIFVNLIRMTVIPLVASMLIATVGAMTTSGKLGRLGARAALAAFGLLASAAVASVLVAGPILARIPIDQAAALALRGPATATLPGGVLPAETTAVAGRFVDLVLVPQNIVKAAADDAILPVILFAVLFGFALARVGDAKRGAVLRAVEGIADAMQRVVSWILQVAPIGVFALAVPLASRLGLSVVAAVVVYVALVVALTVVAVAVFLYPLGILAGPMSASQFVLYCAPSQAIAFASRSSLAALPAAVESAERAGLAPTVSRLVLPLAISVFHFGAAVAQPVGALFVARLFGVALSPSEVASIVLAVVFTSFTVPGIPGGSIVAVVPVLFAAHLPIDAVGILLAVDTIPDMFRTTANVTGAMTLAAVVGGSRQA
jgi:Na+/H+-dicarboxylate symporter